MKFRYLSYILLLTSAFLYFLRNNFGVMYSSVFFYGLIVGLFITGGVIYFVSYTLERFKLQKEDGQHPVANILWTLGGLLVILGAFAHFMLYSYGMEILTAGFVLAICGLLGSRFLKSNDQDQDDDVIDQ